MVAFFAGGGLDATGVTAGIGFGERKSAELLAGCDDGQILLLLLFATGDQDGIHSQTRSTKCQGYTGIHGAKLFGYHGQVHHLAADPIILFRNQDGKEIALFHHFHDVPRENPFFIILFTHWLHLLDGDATCQVTHLDLVFCQKVIHYLNSLISYL